VWGQQHDPISLEIVPARKYELAGLAGRESAAIMRYLMSLPTPDDDVVRAVHASAAWFRERAITGFRYDGYGLRADPNGGPIWARLTEVGSNRPIFANRDAVKLYDWDKLTDRRTGYAWFGTEPAAALKEYDEWAQAHRAHAQ
jgi:PelA/Pel-15E family pectate lyase